MGFLRKGFLWMAALAVLWNVSAVYGASGPAEYIHGDIEIAASVDVQEDGVIALEAGESFQAIISPYIHVQYAGCEKTGCPEICGGYDCFEIGKGCKCEGEELCETKTAAVIVETSDTQTVAASDPSAQGTVQSREAGSQAPGEVTLTAVREGEAQVTVTASLKGWKTASCTFTVKVGKSGEPVEDPTDIPSAPGSEAKEPPVANQQRLSAAMNGSGKVTFELESYDPDWAANITSVYVDGAQADGCAVDENGLTFPTSVFTKAKITDYEIRVEASGYRDFTARVTVRKYGAQHFYVRLLDADGKIKKARAYTMDQMIALSNEEKVYQTVCGMRGITSYKAKGVYMEELLKDAGITFGKGMTARLRTNDAATQANDPENEAAYYDRGTFTYEELIGAKRYVFPNVYTDSELKEKILAAGKFTQAMNTALGSSPKEEIKPMIVYAYTESVWLEDPDNDQTDSEYGAYVTDERAFKFLFGIAMDPGQAGKIKDGVTTWSAAYGVFGMDIQEGSAAPEVKAPGQVKIKKASSAGYKSIRITWNKVSGATAYKIWRAASKNGKYREIQTVKGVSYTDSGLVTGKTYYYKAQAVKKTGAGSPLLKGKLSAAKSAKPLPGKASIRSVKRNTARKATLQWKKVAGASGYQIYRADSKNGKYTKIHKASFKSRLKYTDIGLKKGKAYYYKVRAYRLVGKKKVQGAYSAARKVKKK